MVTVPEVGTVLVLQLSHQFRTADSLSVHSHECLHAVSAVYVEQLACRSQSVCGIHIASVFAVVVKAPVVPIVRPEVLEIVYV